MPPASAPGTPLLMFAQSRISASAACHTAYGTSGVPPHYLHPACYHAIKGKSALRCLLNRCGAQWCLLNRWHHNTPHYSITSHHTHHTLRISHPSSLSWHAQAGRCTRSRMHADTRGRGKKYLFLRVHACTHMHMTVRDSRGDNRHKHTTHATALFPNKLCCLSLSLSVSISQNRRDLLLMGGRDQDFLLSSILADISTSPLSAY